MNGNVWIKQQMMERFEEVLSLKFYLDKEYVDGDCCYQDMITEKTFKAFMAGYMEGAGEEE